ncbi:hypothetical protein PTTG_26398 [Puccinia triticina 1-1 BBBD Race 1]|uniref:Uncharacterized protein n=1 Tax=Puccinia triticina (isolate 1-1 / race 1 (BBBD)) TaxID=630390 RepID=A0A180GV30_PUCT1|nr:hypothetical protein PTTG_26398 [Puccinia triticina 1-1 BBBD Race 1]
MENVVSWPSRGDINPDISSLTIPKANQQELTASNKRKPPQPPNQAPTMRSTIATTAALFLALLNSVSGWSLNGLVPSVPSPSIWGQQGSQVSCGNQGYAAINANVLTQVNCGGFPGSDLSCANQGDAAANLNVGTSVNCYSY